MIFKIFIFLKKINTVPTIIKKCSNTKEKKCAIIETNKYK